MNKPYANEIIYATLCLLSRISLGITTKTEKFRFIEFLNSDKEIRDGLPFRGVDRIYNPNFFFLINQPYSQAIYNKGRDERTENLNPWRFSGHSPDFRREVWGEGMKAEMNNVGKPSN